MTQSGQRHGKDAGIARESPDPPGPRAEGAAVQARTSGPIPDRGVRASQGITENITSTDRIPGPSGFLLADVPNRMMALIIDIIVLSIIGFVLALLFGGLVAPAGSLDSAGGELDVVAFLFVLVLQFVISLAYFGYLWMTLRATMGMKLLGVEVGDESDGRSVSSRQALIRWVMLGIPSVLASLAVYVPSVVAMMLSVIGTAWLVLLLYTITKSPTNQGLHDRYAHTVTVKRGRRGA